MPSTVEERLAALEQKLEELLRLLASVDPMRNRAVRDVFAEIKKLYEEAKTDVEEKPTAKTGRKHAADESE